MLLDIELLTVEELRAIQDILYNSDADFSYEYASLNCELFERKYKKSPADF